MVSYSIQQTQEKWKNQLNWMECPNFQTRQKDKTMQAVVVFTYRGPN